MRHTARIAWAGAMVGSALLWLAGCDDDFEPASRVSHTRVLGAVVSVADEPLRATPRPGETADVGFALAGPRAEFDADRVRSLLVSCTFPERFTGIPICQEFLDLLEDTGAAADSSPDTLGDDRFVCEEPLDFSFAGVGLSCQSGAPQMRVPVEDDFEAEAKLVRGVICDGGEPFIDPTVPALFGCEGGERELLVHVRVPIATGADDGNQNPDLGAVQIELNDVTWDSTEPDLTRVDPDACAGWARSQGIREIDPFAHRIRVAVAPDVVETLEDGCERLEVRGFATAGEITPEIGVFEDDACRDDTDDGRARVIEWEGVDLNRPDEDGQLVDFHFALRDGRGGLAVARRTACVYTLAAP